MRAKSTTFARSYFRERCLASANEKQSVQNASTFARKVAPPIDRAKRGGKSRGTRDSLPETDSYSTCELGSQLSRYTRPYLKYTGQAFSENEDLEANNW